MQGSLSLPQRLSLQSIAAIQSYRNFSIRLLSGLHSVPRWQAFVVNEPVQNNSPIRSIHKQKNLRLGGLASQGPSGNTRMRGCSIPVTFSCCYRTDVISVALNRVVAVPGKSCCPLQISSFGNPRQIQRNSAAQQLSIQSQRGHVKKLVVRVVDLKGGQDRLLKDNGAEFKRIVSEDDSITTFYSSDISSANDDDEGMDRSGKTEAKINVSKVDADDSDIRQDEEKGKDNKKLKNMKTPRKTDDSKIKNEGVEQFEEEAGTASKAGKKKNQLTHLTMQRGERVGKYESHDEEEKNRLKDEKKEKAELNLKVKLDKDIPKTMKKDEKKQEKKAKKLKATTKHKEDVDVDGIEDDDEKKKHNRKDKKILTASREDGMESDSDIDNENVEEHDSPVKTMQTTFKVNEELASDSESEDTDESVTDVASGLLESDEEEFKIIEETFAIDIENELASEIEEDLENLEDEEGFWDEDEEGDVVAGDGGYGGGVVLGGTAWGKAALNLAEQMVSKSGSDLSLFAFKVSPDGVIKVRLDKLSDRYGSPTISDIESFSRRFTIALEEAGETGTLPEDVDVEVSSPGAERVVRVPDDLERFKDLPMYVQYLEGKTGSGNVHDQDLTEKDGVLELESLDMDAGLSVWKTADVKINREVKGKGRPLNSKQKKWRAKLPLAALKQVRLFVDV